MPLSSHPAAQVEGADARFTRLSRELGPAIARTARSYAKTTAEREDLEQDIALAVWRALPSFRGEASERTFVLRIAHNQALTFLTRRRARLRFSRLDGGRGEGERRGEEDGVDDVPSSAPDPEVLADLSERMRRVFSALHALPVGQRQVLLLVLEGLSHQEVADVLGVTANNVAVRVNRARAELRRALGGPSHDGADHEG